MTITLTAEEIQILRAALPILTKLIQEPTTPKETPKKKAIAKPKPKPATTEDFGICQYVNRKVWKDIHSMEDLESNSQKCTSKACEVVNGLHLCTKHKKSDIEGLVKAISGTATEEVFIIPDHIEKTHNTEDPTNTEQTILNMDKEITRLYQQSKHESYSCKFAGEECHLILFDKVAYALDVLGLCLGKITNPDVIHSAKMKHKQRLCLEIKDHVQKITKEEFKALEQCELCTGIAK
jgi:hypothetical protein